MPCGTVVGTDEGAALAFGVENDEASLITQSVKINHKRDKKEARDKCGNVIAVAYYNRMAEVEIEGLGTGDLDVGDTVSLANTVTPAVVGVLIIDEVSVELSNEEFVKTNIKASAYELILAVA